MLKRIEWKSWLILVAVCLAIASFMNLLNQVGWLQNAVFSLCFGVPIYCLQHLLRSRKKPMADRWINLIAISIGSCVGFSVIYSYLIHQNITEFGQFDRELLINFLVGLSLSSAIFYFFWIRYRNQTLTIALREQQIKSIEAENLRQKSENRLLQSQMEPHFLFNTLANIQSLIDIDSQLAKNMLDDLSCMLRNAIKNSQQDSTSLSAELQIVRAYLSIQQTRMGERLQVHEQIDPAALAYSLPPMLLQPIVENSIKHGLNQSTETGDLH